MSCQRIMIIPAAGRGTRLGHDAPKFMFPFEGKSLIENVLDIYKGVIDHFIIVVSRDGLEYARKHFNNDCQNIEFTIQKEATGMLDAILLARSSLPALSNSDRIWITWCDQVGIMKETVQKILEAEQLANPAMVVPTIRKRSPYIHFEKDSKQRILRVKQQREGDSMPELGESDMGLFSMSPEAYDLLNNEFSKVSDVGAETGELNFLPFIPWLAERDYVVTVSGTNDFESIGVNTLTDAKKLKEWMRERKNNGN